MIEDIVTAIYGRPMKVNGVPVPSYALMNVLGRPAVHHPDELAPIETRDEILKWLTHARLPSDPPSITRPRPLELVDDYEDLLSVFQSALENGHATVAGWVLGELAGRHAAHLTRTHGWPSVERSDRR